MLRNIILQYFIQYPCQMKQTFKYMPSANDGSPWVVNCPTQPTCIAHCDLCICQLYFITNPQWKYERNAAGQLARWPHTKFICFDVVFAVFVFNLCGFFHTCVGIPKQVIFSKADLKMFLTSDIAWSPLKWRRGILCNKSF